ncbi:MAG: SecY-interacting protein [Psychrobium sp.]
MNHTAQALADFAGDYSKACENETQKLPQVISDESWRSPCEINGTEEGGKISWQQVSQTPEFDFSDIESALELSLHASVKAFYGSFLGASLYGSLDDKQYELIQCWNEEDIKRLCENIIGHILMQRKLKQSHTVFIGSVVNSHLMICVDNDSGAVVLEVPGDDNRTELAPSLVEFLKALDPLATPDEELAYQAPVDIKPGLMPRLKEVMRSLLGRQK